MYGLEPLTQAMNSAAAAGRRGDTMLGHLTPGEMVIPRSAQTPGMMALFAKHMRSKGQNPARYMVGSKFASENPMTGAQEFYDDGGWGDQAAGGGLGSDSWGGPSDDSGNDNNAQAIAADWAAQQDASQTASANMAFSGGGEGSTNYNGGRALGLTTDEIEALNYSPGTNLMSMADSVTPEFNAARNATLDNEENLSWFEKALDYAVPGVHPNQLGFNLDTGRYEAGKGLGFDPASGMKSVASSLVDTALFAGLPVSKAIGYAAGYLGDPKGIAAKGNAQASSLFTAQGQQQALAGTRIGNDNPYLGDAGQGSQPDYTQLAQFIRDVLPQAAAAQSAPQQTPTNTTAPFVPGTVDTSYGYGPELMLVAPWLFDFEAS